MIVYSADIKLKGFGIKKYISFIKDDIIAVSDKLTSKRKQRKLKKYIMSLSCDKLLNKSHLEINSFGCFDNQDVILQLCDRLFTGVSNLSLNDVNGYAAQAVKKYISTFRSVRIYGSRIYKNVQEELYLLNGVCIIISDSKLNNAIDIDSILDKFKKTHYYEGVVAVSYLDMLKHNGVKILDTENINIYN